MKPEINLPPEKLIAQLKGQARELRRINEQSKKLREKQDEFHARFPSITAWTGDGGTHFTIPLVTYLQMFPDAKPYLSSWSETDSDKARVRKALQPNELPGATVGRIRAGENLRRFRAD